MTRALPPRSRDRPRRRGDPRSDLGPPPAGEAAEPRTQVVVGLASPPLAHAGTAGRRPARSTQSSSASRPRSAPRFPAHRIRWRYRLVANGMSVVLPRAELASPRRLPGRPTCLRQRHVPHGGGAGRDDDPRRTSCGARRSRRRRRDQDRDHRRRRRPDAPVLRSSGPRDARRLPEGTAGLHDGEGDRRQGIPTARSDVAPRGKARSTRRSRVTGRTSPASLPATPTSWPRDSASAGSRRGPPSATTRPSRSQPTRTSASTATRRRSSPRSRPPSPTGWT